MTSYKIGNLRLKNPYFLAPMARVNDIAFRTLCKKAGAGLTYTGMMNPLTRNEIVLDDKPAIQIFATETKGMPKFIKHYQKKVQLFDFNLGCPARIAKREGFGAFLHNKLEMIDKILKVMRESTNNPITVKLRKSPQAIKIVKIANKYCDAICIHPRTEFERYSGVSDMEYAKKLKTKTSLPVIYSGDADEKTADRVLKHFDFVMIARKALGNPGIFSKLTGKDTEYDFNDYLKLAQKYGINFPKIKSHALCFTKSKKGAKKLRTKLIEIKNVEEIKEIFKNARI